MNLRIGTMPESKAGGSAAETEVMTQHPRAQCSRAPEREGEGQGMALARSGGGVVAGALLVAAALVTAPDAPHAGAGMGAKAPARILEHPAEAMAAAQARRARQAHRLQRLRTEQAHARMPSTMYASTPDAAPPPHSVAAARPAMQETAPARAAAPARKTSLLALVMPAGTEREGLVRITNRSERAGTVTVHAVDDTGRRFGPARLAVGARATAQLFSGDLERGGRGLSGGVGDGEGYWRLELETDLDIVPLSYVRTPDKFLTSVHDVVRCEAGRCAVPFFNSAGALDKQSLLRVVNLSGAATEVRVEGRDSAGAPAPGGAVRFTLSGGAARLLSAQMLEAGDASFEGALGDGAGKWLLTVSAERPLAVMGLLSLRRTGHLTNLSTVPETAPAQSAAQVFAAHISAPIVQGKCIACHVEGGVSGSTRLVFVRASDPSHEARNLQAFERFVATVDDGAQVVLNKVQGVGHGGGVQVAAGTVEFADMERFLGLLGTDGGAAGGAHVLPLVMPAGTDREGLVRITNRSGRAGTVTVHAVDDTGRRFGPARLAVGARATAQLFSGDLERGGRGLSGGVGDGEGYWRLELETDLDIVPLSYVRTPDKFLTSVHDVVRCEAGRCAVPFFNSAGALDKQSWLRVVNLSGAATEVRVEGRDSAGAPAPGGAVRFTLAGGAARMLSAQMLEAGDASFEGRLGDGAGKWLLTVSAGRPLAVMGLLSLRRTGHLTNLSTVPETVAASDGPLTPQTLFDTVRMAPARKTLRRAALIFAGRIPTDAEYAAAPGGAEALRATIRGLMTGPEFHEFLIRGANDRLLTDRGGRIIDSNSGYFVDFTTDAYRRMAAAQASGDERDFTRYYLWQDRTQHGFRRAPLELIAHVVENDLPYTEVLTADYIMANPWSAAAYGASTRFDDPGDVHAFRPSGIEIYYRHGDGYKSEYDPIVQHLRVLDPGPLITDYPHAGILNTAAFLFRYPTTATNRNRARSRWTYYHFLGLDIEKSASRTTDPVALADTNNPTMHNPACTVCHEVLDPVAGAFQNYGDEGYYKDKWGGVDSLDDLYRHEGGTALSIRAESWRERETLSWPVSLSAGVQTLRVLYTNHFWDEEAREGGAIYLDRLRVSDASGKVIVSREFEDLEPPVAHWGRCGEAQYNPATGRNDYLMLWAGYLECALFVDVEVPRDGAFEVEIVAWSIGRDERYEEGGFAKLAVAANAYQEGDTWYRDMRIPGFRGEIAPSSDNSVQWLARRIVADERFAEATVKFWWPAVMGSEVAEPPEDDGDADFEGLLLAANAQGAEVTRLANGFRRGFRGRTAYNLKDLLVEIVLSKWFRADVVEDDNPVRRVALRDAGARRLLTPEELAHKTGAITGFRWGRHIRTGCWPSCDRQPDALTDRYRLLYGGIDSDGITARARDITSVMAGVARRHAAVVSCPVVMRDFYLLSDAERRLFTGIDQHLTPGLELSEVFEIEADSYARPQTFFLRGPLSAGPKTVRLTFQNDLWAPPDGDRNIRLDRLTLRDSSGSIVTRRELEDLEPAGDCNHAVGDHFALHCNGSVDVPLEVPAAGRFEIEIVAWADQAGDELPRLSVFVEAADGSGAGADAIRSKLVELYEKLLGVQVTPYSPDVEAAYRLFVDVMARGREADDTSFRGSDCYWNWLEDLSYFDGILEGAVVEHEDEDGWRWYAFDRPHVEGFMDNVDWSDPNYAAQAWAVVLGYLLMDYRYLYL